MSVKCTQSGRGRQSTHMNRPVTGAGCHGGNVMRSMHIRRERRNSSIPTKLNKRNMYMACTQEKFTHFPTKKKSAQNEMQIERALSKIRQRSRKMKNDLTLMFAHYAFRRAFRFYPIPFLSPHPMPFFCSSISSVLIIFVVCSARAHACVC